MTRTARAAYPRAVIKDRSESRTGRDPSVRKSGAGHYNWGPLVDMIGINVIDKDMEVKSPSESLINSNSVTRCKHPFRSFMSPHSFILAAVSPQRQHEKRKIPTPEEVTKARMFRKNAFKANGTSHSNS